MSFPHGETVRVERANGTDKWGDPVEGTFTFPVHGVAFAPRSSSEDNANRSTVIVGLTMYVPAVVDIRPTDRVVRGTDPPVRYQVVGEPGQWCSPFTGWVAGLEVAVERVTG